MWTPTSQGGTAVYEPLVLGSLNGIRTLPCYYYLYINSGRWCLCHVPSTFVTVNTHANVFFVLRLLLAASAKSGVTLFRQIVTLRGIYRVNIECFGEHLGRPKIAHGSHNDVRRLCWPNFRDIHGLQLVDNVFGSFYIWSTQSHIRLQYNLFYSSTFVSLGRV